MRKDESKPDIEDYLQPTGVGGQVVPPADDALIVPDDEVEEDDTGVNEEDISPEDDELLDAGESPEFDHSLRRHKPSTD